MKFSLEETFTNLHPENKGQALIGTAQPAQDKKFNLPNVTQWCKDVYYFFLPIYTM